MENKKILIATAKAYVFLAESLKNNNLEYRHYLALARKSLDKLNENKVIEVGFRRKAA